MRAGLQTEARALLTKTAPGSKPHTLAAGHLSLAEGDAEAALQAARRQQKTTRDGGLLLLEADASELAAAALVALGRWDEARDEASAAIAFCEDTGYRNLLWRLLAHRAAAHARLGADKEARADRAAAEALLEQLVGAIPTDAWKATFLAQPLAQQALA